MRLALLSLLLLCTLSLSLEKIGSGRSSASAFSKFLDTIKVKKQHYDLEYCENGRFKNLNSHPRSRRDPRAFWKFAAALLYSKSWPKYFVTPEQKVLNERESQLRAYFVNHATFLIQIGGVNVLTDPIWSKRASPFSFAGPKRVTNPGIKMDDLPQIDVVLVSHDHYDHLDLDTILELERRFKPRFFVGLGVKRLLDKYKVSNVQEMAWWSSCHINPDLYVTFVPAKHHSGRGLFDANCSLWGGFVIKGRNHTVHFLGDTAYDEQCFREIKLQFPKIDLALIPIGAYETRKYLKDVHVNPEEAVLLHKILCPRLSVAMHYGTFRLGTEGFSRPLTDLAIALEKHDIPDGTFVPLQHGGSVMLNSD